MDLEVPEATADGASIADREDFINKYMASERSKFGREIDRATAEAEVDEWLLKQATFAPAKTRYVLAGRAPCEEVVPSSPSVRAPEPSSQTCVHRLALARPRHLTAARISRSRELCTAPAPAEQQRPGRSSSSSTPSDGPPPKAETLAVERRLERHLEPSREDSLLDLAEARALNARLTRSLEFAEAATAASPAQGQRCAPARGFDALAAAGGYVAKKRPPPPKGAGNVVAPNATSSSCTCSTAASGSRKRMEAPDEDVGAGVGLPAASRAKAPLPTQRAAT